ncbi:Pre-mRNA-splicing factor SYF1 [Chamberlinius hualienensis]
MISEKSIVFNEADIPYEEEILRNPYSVKQWLRYIDHKKDAGKDEVINLIYERALKELPGSYKLWYNYLRLRRNQVQEKCVTDPSYDEVCNAFERALVFMHKMPRIWIDYCEFLVDQRKITRTRKAFDRALRALPVTQHNRIWPLYLKFVKSHDINETAVRVYRRFLKLSPECTEEFIDYLKSIGRLDEAAVKLAEIVNNHKFVSKEGKSNFQLWNELCDLISKNPTHVVSLKVDAIIRGGLRRYTDQIGILWNALADYYVRSALFERARDVYEEAIQTVNTVLDFTEVFDSYAQFEESMTNLKLEASAEKGFNDEDEVDLELRLARFEDLMDRRPLLLNSVLLRQNPHNVHEWHKRVKLFEGKPKEIISTFTEAVQTVDPKLSKGKLHTLWVAFAKFYDENGQIADARTVFQKAVQVPYCEVDDLANVWCEWAEMEIRHENYDEAMRLMHKATAAPPRKVDYHDGTEIVQNRVYKSLKLWAMYADLEESFGTFKSCKAVYDRMIELRIATPQIIMNYGLYLEENNYFEDAFKAYEKGIALFSWPICYEIWTVYITKFLAREGGKKLERARDLFEQCLKDCPPNYAKAIYLLFAKLEEEHGLARHAMAIYDRATKAVAPEEQFEMFNIYIKKAAEIYGVTYTRTIYEKAIETLNDEQSRVMCIQFADLETKLGEIDRARAIYAHCSQMCDPRITSEFWDTWKDFEIRHGNEDTVREMLRIKRSVQAKYNTQVNFMSAQMMAVSSGSSTVADLAPGGNDDMRMLEVTAAQMAKEASLDKPRASQVAFVRGGIETSEQNMVEMVKTTNPDEIKIDDDFASDEEAEIEEVNIEKQPVPGAVFGKLHKDEDDD